MQTLFAKWVHIKNLLLLQLCKHEYVNVIFIVLGNDAENESKVIIVMLLKLKTFLKITL